MSLPFHCPETGAPLSKTSQKWSAPNGKSYLIIDEIPWLVRHPENLVAEWQVLAQQTLGELRAAGLAAEQAESSLVSTQKRMQKLATSYSDQGKLLEQLLAKFLATPIGEPVSQALQKILPANQRLLSYAANIFRDWNWGEEENERTLELVKRLLPAKTKGQFVFLGCGSGRFLYDVHSEFKPDGSLGVDINPLLLTIAQKMLQGGELSLYEFPSLPKSPEEASILRPLKARSKLKGNWQLALADLSALPLADGSADVVFTPWLLDILPFETAGVVRNVHALLKPGGIWLQLGPLGFRRRNPTENLTPAEIQEQVKTLGFEIQKSEQLYLPYNQSPAESQHRTEWITAFAAQRDDQPANRPALKGLPNWLLDPTDKIPRLKSIEASLFVHRLYAEVLSLVDGQRSVEEIAAALNQNFALEADQALGVALRFFRSAWEAELWE